MHLCSQIVCREVAAEFLLAEGIIRQESRKKEKETKMPEQEPGKGLRQLWVTAGESGQLGQEGSKAALVLNTVQGDVGQQVPEGLQRVCHKRLDFLRIHHLQDIKAKASCRDL